MKSISTIQKGTYVRISKIGVNPHGLPACPAPFHTPNSSGMWDGILSIPVDYWMEGRLLQDIKVSGHIRLHRTVRNGVIARGLFHSSIVCKIEGYRITTCNSVYTIIRVPPLTRKWQLEGESNQFRLRACYGKSDLSPALANLRGNAASICSSLVSRVSRSFL